MIAGSTASFYATAQTRMDVLRARSETLQQQVATGERLTRPSDDPVASARLRTLARTERLDAAAARNTDAARADLALADGALSELANLVIQAKDRAIMAAGITSAEGRQAVGVEIAALRDSILGLANSSNSGGQAVFGGLASAPAYERAGGVIAYRGTPDAQTLDIGEGRNVTRTFGGAQVFGPDGPDGLFATLGRLADDLASGSAPAADTLGELDTGLERITTAQTITGTRLAFLNLIDGRRTQQAETRVQEQSRIGGADLAQTISSLQQTMTVLEASQASFVKLASLSLFKLLR